MMKRLTKKKVPLGQTVGDVEAELNVTLHRNKSMPIKDYLKFMGYSSLVDMLDARYARYATTAYRGKLQMKKSWFSKLWERVLK